VIDALHEPLRPWWLLYARAATPTEDRLGVDIVVRVDPDGDLDRRAWLGIQVKSSERFARRWERDHPALLRRVRVVVISPDDDLPTIYGKALGALVALRDPVLVEILRARAMPEIASSRPETCQDQTDKR
jgi:hypothetical protein